MILLLVIIAAAFAQDLPTEIAGIPSSATGAVGGFAGAGALAILLVERAIRRGDKTADHLGVKIDRLEDRVSELDKHLTEIKTELRVGRSLGHTLSDLPNAPRSR